MTVKAEQWLSPQELADMLGLPVRTIYYWRSQDGRGPRGHVIGKHVRFRLSDVESWLEQQADTPRGAA